MIIYVLVAGATVSVIVIVLSILIRCLNWRTQRYHQQIQLQEVKPHQLQVVKPPNRRPQVTPITDNNEPFNDEDENPYEYIPSQSPVLDSAFGSRDTFGNIDEVAPPSEQAYPESATSSDSGILSHEQRQIHPSPPTSQIPLLAREHLQAVTAPEGSILEDVLDSLSNGNIPKYTIIKVDSRDPPNQREQHQPSDNSPQQIQHEYFIYPWGQTQQRGVAKKTQYPYKKDTRNKTQYMPLNQDIHIESENSLDENQRKRTEPFTI